LAISNGSQARPANGFLESFFLKCCFPAFPREYNISSASHQSGSEIKASFQAKKFKRKNPLDKISA
jgi:hypothetical protein